MVAVTFTASGLVKLGAARDRNPAVRVVTTIPTMVGALVGTSGAPGEGLGAIFNRALLFPSKAAIEGTEGAQPLPSNPAVTRWGSFRILKTNERKEPLTGAVFALYVTGTSTTPTDEELKQLRPLKSDLRTGSDGMLAITGLRYSAWVSGSEVSPGSPGYQHYWLVETDAPSGYGLLAEPLGFVVDDSTTQPGFRLEVVDPKQGEEVESGTDAGKGKDGDKREGSASDNRAGSERGRGAKVGTGGWLFNSDASLAAALLWLAAASLLLGGGLLRFSRRRRKGKP
jgi:hypothetical protein